MLEIEVETEVGVEKFQTLNSKRYTVHQYEYNVIIRPLYNCIPQQKLRLNYQSLSSRLSRSFSSNSSCGITFKNEGCCSMAYSIFSTMSAMVSLS